MSTFKQMIARHRDRCNELHKRVHEAHSKSHLSDVKKEEWQKAARDFRSFESEVDVLLHQASSPSIVDDPSLREFAFDYLSVDPMYFNSGYAKENLLKSIKNLEFSEGEKEVLQQTILRRVKNGAYREFKHFCRRIPVIVSDEFEGALRSLAASKDDDIKRRALFALKNLPN